MLPDVRVSGRVYRDCQISYTINDVLGDVKPHVQGIRVTLPDEKFEDLKIKPMYLEDALIYARAWIDGRLSCCGQ